MPTIPDAPPAHLSDSERAAWHEAEAKLRPGPRTLAQLASLEAYAVERARWLEADAHIREHGPTIQVRDDRGEIKTVIQAPELAIAQKAQARALALLKTLRVR